jgi:predicted nucleotidyltransferase
MFHIRFICTISGTTAVGFTAVNVSAPILDIVPGPRGLVLTALTRLTGSSSGRAIAAQAGVPTTTTARILTDLVEAGIVLALPAGNAVLYSLNRDHLTARAISELAGLRFDLVQEIRDRLKTWSTRPVAGWLFGSVARADGDRSSDVDLLLVAPPGCNAEQWEQDIGALAEFVERRTGNPVQIVEHTVASFLALDARQTPLTKALRADGIDLVDRSWAAITSAAA